MVDGSNTIGDENNPYRATELEATNDPFVASSTETIRREHIQHEASIKSIGQLYMLQFLLCGAVTAGLVLNFMNGFLPGMVELFLLSTYCVLGTFMAYTGWALQRLRPWSRWSGVVFSVLGLAFFPFGTLICPYFLYLFLSRKGAMVFSETYQAIIRETPNVRAGTSPTTWMVLIIFVLALVAFVVGFAVFS